MDEPIIYPRYKLSNHFFPKPLNPYQRLSLAVKNDEKDEFMRLIKDPGFEQMRDIFTVDRIFDDDALEIAIEVFNGKTKGLIDMEDKLKDGMTPLHLAAISRAPRLTQYLLQRGDKVDAVCDYKNLNLEHATPFDIAMESVMFIGESRSLFQMLWRLCYHKRDCMEVIRMLVRSTQNTTWARQAFFKYARDGDLLKLAALFLAVPELVLSSPERKLSLFSKLDLELNSLKNKTDVKQLSLLLDVFALVGPKLAAYIRLEEFAMKSLPTKRVNQSHMELDFFLREVAHKKSQISSPDYYLSFFEATNQHQNSNDDDDDLPDWNDCVCDLEEAVHVFNFLPDLLMRRDFDRTDIYRLIPSLESEDAGK
ncbi:uncharacterized protein LOC141588608 [Silene latifolia]|uniref:uncharacterized protein LOC141588608 n=1 Tax=Silene latifolia TaxID=37657 RepID=UPI003D76E788